MGFYISKDGLHVMSTLDTNTSVYLTTKGKKYTYYAKKIQRWWRSKKLQQMKAVIMIQRWWRKRLSIKNTKEPEFELDGYSMIIPLYFINTLILLFRYILN